MELPEDFLSLGRESVTYSSYVFKTFFIWTYLYLGPIYFPYIYFRFLLSELVHWF